MLIKITQQGGGYRTIKQQKGGTGDDNQQDIMRSQKPQQGVAGE